MKTSYNKKKLIRMYVYSVLDEYSNTYNNHGLIAVVSMLIANIVGCYKHIPYSFIHSLCYRKVEHHLLGRHIHNWHDFDKILLFIIFPWLGPDCINAIHVLTQNHHPIYWVQNLEGKWIKHLKIADEVDWEQAIIDWECARFTKPDKPLDAYDTYLKYYKSLDDEFDRRILYTLDKVGLIHWGDYMEGDVIWKTDKMKTFKW